MPIKVATNRINGVWALAGFDIGITFPKETGWDNNMRIYGPSSRVSSTELTTKSKEASYHLWDAGSKHGTKLTVFDGTTNDCRASAMVRWHYLCNLQPLPTVISYPYQEDARLYGPKCLCNFKIKPKHCNLLNSTPDLLIYLVMSYVHVCIR